MIDLELLTRELGGTWEMWHRIGQVATNGIVMVRYSGGEFSAKTCEHHLIGFSGSAATPQGALANLCTDLQTKKKWTISDVQAAQEKVAEVDRILSAVRSFIKP